MVTDIIDKDEPLRNKLRTLGAGILSDMYAIGKDNTGHAASMMLSKISELMSFLTIASSVGLVSEMNVNILRKEFSLLCQSAQESGNSAKGFNGFDRKIDLAEFFSESVDAGFPSLLVKERGNLHPHGHTSIGLQKGGTLMKALSDKNLAASLVSNKGSREINADNFDILKKERRQEITRIIKLLGGSATIKDIKDKIKTIGEKTLQRELVSMVKDGILGKTGEKRWSRYFLA
jgi:hypothetical protein